MEPNPVFTARLAHELKVSEEAVFWALRDLIQNKVPLTRNEAEQGAK